MIAALLLRGIVLAQDTGFSDFLAQVRGLILFICALSTLWLVLFVLSLQRAAERRRRARLGLEPPPGFWVWAYRYLTGQHQDPTAGRPARAPAAPSDALVPDLDLLTGGLPDLDRLPEVPPAVPARTARSVAQSVPDGLEAALPLDAARFDAALSPQEETMPAPSSSDDVLPGAPPPADAVELLRVFRDLSDGSLIVEIGGRRFRSLSELRSANLERRLTAVVRDLAQMLRGASATAPASGARPSAATTPASAPAGALPTSEMPSMAPGTMFKQMMNAARGQKPEPPAAEPLPELSVAEEIDALLQARLAALPDFRGRKIKVETAAGGGVRIQVDDQSYEGIGDVAEEEVRALLQDVVREWERKK